MYFSCGARESLRISPMDIESVNNLESNGHALNGSAQNGVTQINNVAVKLNKTDQDIVRLIGQYLKIVGLG